MGQRKHFFWTPGGRPRLRRLLLIVPLALLAFAGGALVGRPTGLWVLDQRLPQATVQLAAEFSGAELHHTSQLACAGERPLRHSGLEITAAIRACKLMSSRAEHYQVLFSRQTPCRSALQVRVRGHWRGQSFDRIFAAGGCASGQREYFRAGRLLGLLSGVRARFNPEAERRERKSLREGRSPVEVIFPP